jgi:hypothetical protein
MKKFIYLQLWPKLGREKFSICLHLAHSSGTIYRNDEIEAPGYVLGRWSFF